MKQEKKLRVKGESFSPFAARARSDYQKVIINHPDAFDAILFRPVTHNVVDDVINKIEFGDLNSKIDDIRYQDPIEVVCVESTNSSSDEYFIPNFDTDDSMGFGESQILLLRISEFSVPQGSVVCFLVALADGGTQRQNWYVHRSNAIGVPAIGFLHSCIPFGDLESSDVQPLTESQALFLESIDNNSDSNKEGL